MAVVCFQLEKSWFFFFQIEMSGAKKKTSSSEISDEHSPLLMTTFPIKNISFVTIAP